MNATEWATTFCLGRAGLGLRNRSSLGIPLPQEPEGEKVINITPNRITRGPYYLVTIDSPLVNTETGQHLSIRLQINDTLVGLNPTVEGKVDYIMKQIRDYVEGLVVAEGGQG